jgi:formylglycine-generating enzyme required for sulfatase activity
MAENRKLKVFLCHSKDDKPKVRELYRRLVADGFNAWLDEEKLMPGQDWDLEIRKAVRESDVIVVCLSNGSITKAGYVQKEIRFALDVADEQPEGAIYIIPAKIEECEAPLRLSKWQWVNMYEEKGYEMLHASLELRAKALGIVLDLPFDFEPQMVRIPAGTFLMGSTKEQAEKAIIDGLDRDVAESEQPQHTVELPEYSIGKYPVTNREYQAFIRDANYKPPRGWHGDQFPSEKGGHPVVNVSWDDAVVYCQWLSEKSGKPYRLPTEAEWEKAARCKSENESLVYPWGNTFDSKNANTNESYIGDTSDVGKFSPQGDSPYGCADMAGNVWEWCNDWYDENEYKQRQSSSVKDPQGPQKGDARVWRGGSFVLGPRNVRCAYRDADFPNFLFSGGGFRVCVSPILKSEL